MNHNWTHHPATGFTYCSVCGTTKGGWGILGTPKPCPGPRGGVR